MNKKQHAAMIATFEAMHDNPPAPFNPDYDPNAKARSEEVARELEAEGYYDTHTREECAAEYARRCARKYTYLYTPNNCPSTHHNRGDDVCADCGKYLG